MRIFIEIFYKRLKKMGENGEKNLDAKYIFSYADRKCRILTII